MEDNRVEFSLNESLKYYLSDPSTVPTPDADPDLLDLEHDPESITAATVDAVVNPIVDGIAENPEALMRSSFFDSLQLLLKYASPVAPTPRSVWYPHEMDRELSCDYLLDALPFCLRRP